MQQDGSPLDPPRATMVHRATAQSESRPSARVGSDAHTNTRSAIPLKCQGHFWTGAHSLRLQTTSYRALVREGVYEILSVGPNWRPTFTPAFQRHNRIYLGRPSTFGRSTHGCPMALRSCLR